MTGANPGGGVRRAGRVWAKARAGLGLAAVAAVIAGGCGAIRHGASTHPAAQPAGRAAATVRPGRTTTVTIPGGVTVIVPPGSAPAGATVSASITGAPPAASDRKPLSTPVHLQLSTGELTGPATLSFPYNPVVVPAGVNPADAVGIATYDPAQKVWVDQPARVDTATHRIVATVGHFSWWEPWTWNWSSLGAEVSQDLLQAIGKRVGMPTCSGARPGYVLTVLTHAGASDPLRSCAGSSGGILQVNLADNRSYGMILHEPVPVGTATHATPTNVVQAAVDALINRHLPSGELYLPPLTDASVTVPNTKFTSADFTADPTVATVIPDLVNILVSMPLPDPTAIAGEIGVECGQLLTTTNKPLDAASLSADVAGATGCMLAALRAVSASGGLDGLSLAQLDHVSGILTVLHYANLAFLGVTLGASLGDYLLGTTLDGPLRSFKVWHSVGTAPGGWSDRHLVITPFSLGRVRTGMSLKEADRAAGLTLEEVGDGFAYPTPGPRAGMAILSVFANNAGPVGCVIAGGAPTAQVISTPEGFVLGESVAQLKQTYGAKLVYVPAPASGFQPVPGYVVSEDGGVLAFVLAGGRITGIVGGPAGTTPSLCGQTAIRSGKSTAPQGYGSQPPLLQIPRDQYSGRYPTVITFSGDSSNVVSKISWSSWTTSAAVGRGTWIYESCNPDCATGPVTPYPAKLLLTDAVNGIYHKITESTMGPHGFTLTLNYPFLSDLDLGAS